MERVNHTHPPRSYLTYRFTCSRRLNRTPPPRAWTGSPNSRPASPMGSGTRRTSAGASASPAPAAQDAHHPPQPPGEHAR